MKFSEAEEKLGKLFPGRYMYVAFGRTTHTDGRLETRCTLYVDPKIMASGPTFQVAFDLLMQAVEEQAVEETPDVEDVHVAVEGLVSAKE